ncbi:MAG: alpha/beta fold hydrolase [Rubricoccaceae bacterium]
MTPPLYLTRHDAPPALPESPSDADGTFVCAGNVRLWVEREGSGPPLLLVPGLGSGTWLWARSRAALGARFSLVMPELRGSGRSDKPDERYSVAGFAEDLVAVLDAYGIARAHVLGASMGGFVAQYLAATRPDRVDRLVLVGTAVGGQNQIGPSGDVLARTVRPRGRTRRERLEDGYALSFSDAFRRGHPALLDFITAWRLAYPQPEAAYYRQLLGANAYDGARCTPRIAAPTLVCAGEEDPLVPRANAEVLAALLPDARVRVFPGRHLFFWEHADAFSEAVLEFLGDDSTGDV